MVERAKEVKTTTTRVSKNVAEFVEASALAGVSGFAIYTGLNNDGIAYSALLFAGAVVVLRAFQQLVKVFNKK